MSAKVSEVKEGSLIRVDRAFTCVKPYTVHQVSRADDGLYFPCKEGRHYLSGQLSDDGMHYVGLDLVSS